MNVVIVSGADTAYFPFLRDLLRSIRDEPRSQNVSIGIMDVGLQPDERRQIEDEVDAVVTPGWDYRPGNGEPEHIKAFDARNLLPRYFPGFDIYVWIDADAWVQDWAAVELLVRAARTGAMAIVPEVHAGYDPVLPDLYWKRRFLRRAKLDSWAHRRYRKAYGLATMDRHGFRQVMNSGVFALRGDAPHWKIWGDSYRLALQRKPTLWVDQIACNHAIYENDLDVQLLPAWCNWICSRGLPAFDPPTGELVEPFLPHQRLGIVHLTWHTKEREQTLRTTNGGTVTRSLRYDAARRSVRR